MLPPPHPIDCIPFFVTSAARAVSIKRRLGKPSKQHCELKKTSEEHEEEHPNTSGAPRFSFNPIPHG